MIGIMAMSENRCIGLNGKLPWKVSGDFKWFKEFTMGKTVIVGRKTFDTLPPLKGRKICMLSNSLHGVYSTKIIEVYQNNESKFDELYIRNYEQFKNETIWKDGIIAGGKSIYELFMPYITEFYVSHIHTTCDGDIFMSEFEHLFSKNEVVREFEGGKVIKYSK